MRALPFVFLVGCLSGCASLAEDMQAFGAAVSEQAAESGEAVVDAIGKVASGGGAPAVIAAVGVGVAFVAGVLARFVFKRRAK